MFLPTEFLSALRRTLPTAACAAAAKIATAAETAKASAAASAAAANYAANYAAAAATYAAAASDVGLPQDYYLLMSARIAEDILTELDTPGAQWALAQQKVK